MSKQYIFQWRSKLTPCTEWQDCVNQYHKDSRADAIAALPRCANQDHYEYRLVERTTTEVEVDDGVRYGVQRQEYGKWVAGSTYEFPSLAAAQKWMGEMMCRGEMMCSGPRFRIVKITPL